MVPSIRSLRSGCSREKTSASCADGCERLPLAVQRARLTRSIPISSGSVRNLAAIYPLAPSKRNTHGHVRELAKHSRAADTVHSISASPCAVETKAASNGDGGG